MLFWPVMTLIGAWVVCRHTRPFVALLSQDAPTRYVFWTTVVGYLLFATITQADPFLYFMGAFLLTMAASAWIAVRTSAVVGLVFFMCVLCTVCNLAP